MVVLPTLAFGASGVLLPLRLRGLGVAEVGIATAYLLAAILEVIVNPLVGRWFDRSGGAPCCGPRWQDPRPACSRWRSRCPRACCWASSW